MHSPASIKRRPLKTQVDTVIYFFKKMDEEMIGDLLFDKFSYQDMNKNLFVRKLGDLFHSFTLLGDTQLFGVNEIRGEYNGTDVIAMTFIGNQSHNYIDILFEVNNKGLITDMYEFEDPEADRDVNMIEGRLFLDNFELDEDEYYGDESF